MHNIYNYVIHVFDYESQLIHKQINTCKLTQQLTYIICKVMLYTSIGNNIKQLKCNKWRNKHNPM